MPEPPRAIRSLSLVSLLLSGLEFAFLFQEAQSLGMLWISRRWMALLLGTGLVFLAALALAILSWRAPARLERGLDGLLAALGRLPWLAAAWLLLAPAAFAWLLLGPIGERFTALSTRLFLFWWLSLGGAVWLRALQPRRLWGEALAFSGLLGGAIYMAATFAPDISTFPFSMGWSETSRYYFASLFFAEQLYGMPVPPTVLHPSRYLLQAVPFLIPELPLWFHRLWQVLLWIALPAATVIALARRLRLPERLLRWSFILWAFLFIFQGPVYYHLAVCALIVLAGFDRTRFRRSLGVVLLASVWAGISRVNWFPVPGLLATTLYLLEEPVAGKPLGRYLLPPAAWSLAGGLTALAAQFAYAVWSGNDLEKFSSSFTSDLLWYRLWPNPSYPEGILPAILLVSLPILALLALFLRRQGRAVHPLRLLGLAAVLLVFFAGGLVVSVKIGGGNNLHNLDAYLLFLLVIGAVVLFRQVVAEPGVELPAWQPGWLLLALVVTLPVFMTLRIGAPSLLPDRARAEKELRDLRAYVTAAAERGGEVLFIAERHLLTFDMIEGIRLVPEHERTFLLEMAMAGNQEYLGRFRQDIESQRFAVIVSQQLFLNYKGSAESFGEENDAWVRWVAEPILCYYNPEEKLRGVGLHMLTPRTDPGNCPPLAPAGE